MTGLQARGHTGTGIPASVHDVSAIMMLGLVQERLDPRLHERPSAGIQRLLLTPDDVLGIRILVQVFLEQCPWERIQLLDARKCSVLDLVRLTVLDKCGVHLTRAHDDSFDLVRLLDGVAVFGFGDDPLEV